MITHIAVLKHLRKDEFRAIPVPEGQSLEFDPDGATRRWLWPHIGTDHHLMGFVELESFGYPPVQVVRP